MGRQLASQCLTRATSYPYCYRRRLPVIELTGLLKLILAMNAVVIFGVNADSKELVMNIPPEDQSRLVLKEEEKCHDKMLHDPPWPHDSPYCPRVWDDLLCWPPTQAGTTAEQPCPDYVHGSKVHEAAMFECLDNGTWYYSDDHNRTWTNFSLCFSATDVLEVDVIDSRFDLPGFAKEHLDRIRLVYNIGYGISLVSLVLSVVIMLGFKKLHCPRNTIHLNLFFSFILRASMSFMKENLLVKGVGFPFDVDTEDGVTTFKDGTHWECKLFFTCFYYILAANYMWICAEALYLYLLIHKAVFTERSGIRWYILFGWGSPLVFVIPWVIVKAICEDFYCWNIHFEEGYFWIMRGPIVLSIVVNVFCFVSIVRVLFTKLSAVNSPEANRYRYRKLAKSTLVLIPLFGVHYVIFAWYPRDKNHTVELVQLYYEMLFNSIQGFFVALLYCFLNGEVRSEIKKKWQRFQITKLHKFPKRRSCSHNGTTDSTFFSRPRESNASMSLNPEYRYHFDNGRAVARKASVEQQPLHPTAPTTTNNSNNTNSNSSSSNTDTNNKYSGGGNSSRGGGGIVVGNGRGPPLLTTNANMSSVHDDEAAEPMISMQDMTSCSSSVNNNTNNNYNHHHHTSNANSHGVIHSNSSNDI